MVIDFQLTHSVKMNLTKDVGVAAYKALTHTAIDNDSCSLRKISIGDDQTCETI